MTSKLDQITKRAGGPDLRGRARPDAIAERADCYCAMMLTALTFFGSGVDADT